MSHTLPAHVSLFTSRYPREHGVVFNGLTLQEPFPLLADMLKNEGYHTGAVVGAAVMDKLTGLSKGFDYYDDQFDDFTFLREQKFYRRTADEVVKRTINWIKRQDPDNPIFCFLHFFDAHETYELTPKKYRSMFKTDEELLRIMREKKQDNIHTDNINQYDGSIRFIDDSLNPFWAFLKNTGIYDNALIIILSDHGEGLGEHDFYSHDLYLYEEMMHIPLIMRFPEGEFGMRNISSMVSLMDIAPTVLDYLNLQELPDARSESMLDVVRGEKGSTREYLLFQRRWFPEKNRLDTSRNWAPGEKYAVRGQTWKFIWASDEPDELYNLEDDPEEMNNLNTKEVEVSSLFNREFEKYVSLVPKSTAILPKKMNKKKLEQLKALGYIQ
jgi:arylsulfatase A-like enzyme